MTINHHQSSIIDHLFSIFKPSPTTHFQLQATHTSSTPIQQILQVLRILLATSDEKTSCYHPVGSTLTSWWLNHPFEKILSQIIEIKSSPNKGEHKKYLEATTYCSLRLRCQPPTNCGKIGKKMFPTNARFITHDMGCFS